MTKSLQSASLRHAGKHSPLRKRLDALHRQCDFSQRIAGDPIEFPHRYCDPRDIEVVGLIAAVLAYGRVDLFKAVIDRILQQMGAHPADFLAEFSLKRDAKRFDGMYYRFNTTEDIVLLMQILHLFLRKHGSIEQAVVIHLRRNDASIGPALAGFVAGVHELAAKRGLVSHGFAQFFPSPASGSACKRLNLYLRWMVRSGAPDCGIWKGIRPDQLVIPLDLHISRIGRCFGLTARKSDDWKTAVEITELLKRFDPVDPVKYDFALCHLGITQECHVTKCGDCRFRSVSSSQNKNS
ncbi:MAG TPA: TIGR02757 family protein [Dissulfurispiraceae bacterium]|nr:TIGR02757 family protein [Dissulfurispiraceae bacterium]